MEDIKEEKMDQSKPIIQLDNGSDTSYKYVRLVVNQKGLEKVIDYLKMFDNKFYTGDFVLIKLEEKV